MGWSYSGFPRADIIQGKSKCRYCTALLSSWEVEASVREGFLKTIEIFFIISCFILLFPLFFFFFSPQKCGDRGLLEITFLESSLSITHNLKAQKVASLLFAPVERTTATASSLLVMASLAGPM